MLTPELTYWILLIAQALHLLHHRLAKRHISFVEVTAGVVLCVPTGGVIPAGLLMSAHLVLAGVQVVGSLWIDKLSPRHDGQAMLANLG